MITKRVMKVVSVMLLISMVASNLIGFCDVKPKKKVVYAEEKILVGLDLEVTPLPTPIPTPIPTPKVKKKEVKKKVKNKYNFTKEELDLLARLIYSEGGIESYRTQLYIGSVVLNRMGKKRSLYDVIYDRKNGIQFSVTIKDSNGVAPIDKKPSKKSMKVAKQLMKHGSYLPKGVQVFYSDYCDEGWVRSRKTYCKSSSTIFAYTYEG